jgi:Tfp pilus assembly protein PilZ
MENRKELREKKELRVRIKDGDDTYAATVSSISKTGMSLKTSHVFPTYKVVEILVKVSHEMTPIKGSVRWVNESSRRPLEEKYEMGFSLHSPPQEYIKHFE